MTQSERNPTTALIVGASQGIGLEFVRQLYITEEAQIAAVVQEIQTETAALDYAINCVGVLHEGALQPEKSLRQLNAEQLLRYFQVNSIGAVLLANSD